MKLSDKIYSGWFLLGISLVGALFIIYQNIVNYNWDVFFFNKHYNQPYIVYFILRYLFFVLFIWVILLVNLKKIIKSTFGRRLFYSSVIAVVAFGIYISITFLSGYMADFIGKILVYQFVIITVLTSAFGQIIQLITEQGKKDKEIEQLKTENLQSRYVALTNQINPHFFFNSLNGLTSLIRKKNEANAIEYVNKLSDVFRYILQSDKKSLVSLQEELECVKALTYMMEVRFAKKLVFHINVNGESRNLKLPVLSLLPVIDNIVVHNIIDSEHIMEVTISLNDQMELVVSNPIYPKIIPSETNGTGLKNLENRFILLMNNKIRIFNDGNTFTVYLPLKNSTNENIDS